MGTWLRGVDRMEHDLVAIGAGAGGQKIDDRNPCTTTAL
jgi:hypothetical protein